MRHLDVASASIWTITPDADVLQLEGSAGQGPALDGAPPRIRVGEAGIGRIAAARRPHLTNDVATDPHLREPRRREGLVAFAGAPMIVDEDRVVGVIGVYARRRLGDATLDVLRSIAAQLAQPIERRRAEDALRRHVTGGTGRRPAPSSSGERCGPATF